jgi:hypothetical protein
MIMTDQNKKNALSGNIKIVLGALVGAAGGLVVTGLALSSFEFGLFGAMGGAVVSAIAAGAQVESAERAEA